MTLMVSAYSDIPAVPKTFLVNGSHLYDALKTQPISVSSLVKNINGNSPGSTAVINNFKPEMVPLVYRVGLIMIKIMMSSNIIDKIKSNNSGFLKKFLNVDLFFCFLVKFILKYML